MGDSRCFYSEAYSGFDCPGGWVDYNTGTFTPNAEKKGAGNYAAGSPRKNSNWGGGAGCHFDTSQQQIDQTDAFDSNNNNLVDDPTCHFNNWDAVMVKLPGNLCDNDDGTSDKLDCLSKAAQATLESDLGTWTSAGYLIPGKANLSQKPGSYMVIVREYYDNNFPGWQRHFFCQSWTSPKSKWKIVFEENTRWESSGACYLDNGGSQKLTV